MAGLLDFFGFGGGSDPTGGLLASDPQAAAAALQADMRQQQLAGMAAGLLQSSGPSLMPHSFGQDLGNALVGGMQGRQSAMRNAAAQQQLRGALNSNALQDLTLKYYQDQNAPMGGGPSIVAPGKGPAVASGLMPQAQPVAQSAPQGGLLGPDASGPLPAVLSGNPPDASAAPGMPQGPIGTPSSAIAPQGSAAPIFDRAALANRAAGMFRIPGLAGQAVDLLKLANQGMPEGAFYGQDGALHTTPGYDQYVAGKATNETLGKNLQTHDAAGNIVNLPGAVAANSQMAGGVEGAKSRATLPAELTKIGASGAQTRKTAEFDASITPDSMTVPAVDPTTGKPIVDTNGQPLLQTVQTTKLARAQSGPVVGAPVLTPQQSALLDVQKHNLQNVPVRSQEGGILPGSGAITAGLPAPASPPLSVPGRPPSVLWRPGAGAASAGPAPEAPVQTASASPQSIGGFTTGYGLPHALISSETDAGKGRADQMKEWQKAAVGNQGLLQQLKSLSDVAQIYNTGKLSPDATNAAGWLSSIGANPEALLGDPSKGEEFDKIAANFLTQQVSNLSSQPAHAAFGTIGAGTMSSAKRPETNHDITAQLVARMRWENDLASDAAQKFPNGVPSTDFVSEFTKSHPTQKYLDQARSDIPPFAGMSGSTAKPIAVMGDKLPSKMLPNRWYSGKAVPGGKAVVNPDGTGWWVPNGAAQ